MNEKKNIDRLFQEKFKDFEATPSPSIWHAISKELLTNKKRKKAIPIWWKFTGVAASLLLLFSIWSIVLNPSGDTPEQIIVNTESKNPIKEDLNQEQSTIVDVLSDEGEGREKVTQDFTNNSNTVVNTKTSNISLSQANRTKLSSNVKDNTQNQNTKLAEELPDIKPQSSNRYLRLLAVARLYLDNFDNLQSSWVTQGSYIGQMALKFGANDLGSTMMEENVVAAAGASNCMNQDDMIELINDIGEKPAKRNTAYKTLERFY